MEVYETSKVMEAYLIYYALLGSLVRRISFRAVRDSHRPTSKAPGQTKSAWLKRVCPLLHVVFYGRPRRARYVMWCVWLLRSLAATLSKQPLHRRRFARCVSKGAIPRIAAASRPRQRVRLVSHRDWHPSHVETSRVKEGLQRAHLNPVLYRNLPGFAGSIVMSWCSTHGKRTSGTKDAKELHSQLGIWPARPASTCIILPVLQRRGRPSRTSLIESLDACCLGRTERPLWPASLQARCARTSFGRPPRVLAPIVSESACQEPRS